MMRFYPSGKVSTGWLFVLLLIAVTGVSMGQMITLIPEGADWKYLDDGSDQGTAWVAPDFNDDSWDNGFAQLGFGDGDEVTVLQSGYITYYFRHQFTVDDPSVFQGLLLRLLRDDGAVVYLNGIEVTRSNMPTGSVNHLTLAESGVTGSAEDVFHEIGLSSDGLVVGENTIAVEIHQKRVSSSDISLDLSLEECAAFLIPAGADWKYLDDGSDQGTAWVAPDFNDDSWANGFAQLGFGDGDEVTVLQSGYITYYFRHQFTVDDPSVFQGLLLRLLRDDGAVVYLNGIEVTRSNMPTGSVNHLTLAESGVSGSAEDVFHEIGLSSDGLVVGENTIAVEIHQVRTSSSDISLDLSLEPASQPDVFRKAAYMIYTGSNTGMKIMWQLLGTYDSTIEWGVDTSYSLGSEVTSEYGVDHQHTFTISGLTPNTKYYYRVTSLTCSKTGSFCTAPLSTATSLKFFAYGDTRSNPDIHDTVAEAIVSTFTNDPDYQTLVISVGDLVANGGAENHWDEQFFHPSYTNIQEFLSSMPYQSCIGNHDLPGILFQKYFAYPFVAGRYWSFNYGPVHFTVVDEYTSYAPGSAQYDWIENDLSTTDKIWKILYLHEPGWSAGGSHNNNTDVQDYIQPLCNEYGVSVVFAGHNHYYARAVVDGIHHITTGGGGAPLYAPDPSFPNIVATAESHHYCKIDISGNNFNFEACSPSGSILDSFSITVGGIESENSGSIGRVSLSVSPNPVQKRATVNFLTTTDSHVTIDVFDISGRIVNNLFDSAETAGEHSVLLNTDLLQAGIYFVRMNAGGVIEAEKLVLMN